MDSKEISFKVQVQVDGHTYIADLDATEVEVLTSALSLMNAQVHQRLHEGTMYLRHLLQIDHQKLHDTLDKMFVVLKPILGDKVQSSAPSLDHT